MYAIILITTRRDNRRRSHDTLSWRKAFINWTLAQCAGDEGVKTTPLCYGVAIAAGTLTVLLQKML